MEFIKVYKIEHQKILAHIRTPNTNEIVESIIASSWNFYGS